MKIVNANLFTSENKFVLGEVTFQNGIIESVQETNAASKEKGAQILDLAGLYLLPGFIELQINGGFGQDFTATPDSIWEIAAQLPQFGVTSFLPTIITSPLETIARAQKIVKQKPGSDFCGAMPLGLHVEGPFLNPVKKGTHSEGLLRIPYMDDIRNWTVENGIRLVTLAPEQTGALDIIRELKRRGIVVSAGHSNATYLQALQGFEAGISYGTHIFNAQSPLNHRDPGLPGALLLGSNIPVGIIPDGIHIHPAVIDLVWRLKGNENLTLVTDALIGLGMPPGRYTFGDFEIIVDHEVAKKPDGTLSGSILSEDQALRNFIKFTGCSLAEAVPTLTSTPAKVLGLSNRGKIRQGYLADFVVLDKDLLTVMTITAGKIAYQK